jgi:basic amino acid/polyamine antiporter, APA family
VGKLRKTLGLAGLTFYGVGMIVGAGVYSVVGAAAGLAGRGVWLSFVVGAAVAFLTALSYAELSTMFPRAGAEYVYARAALPRHRLVPFLLGIVLTLAAAGTAATVSLAFAGYLGAFVPLPAPVVALLLVALLTAINILGLHVSSRVNVVFTLLEVVGLVAFIVLGATQPEFGQGVGQVETGGLMAAAALLFFAYLGFEDIVNLAEEAREPTRDVPRAIFVSVGTTTVLYIGVALAAVALIDPRELAASAAPLTTAAAQASPVVAKALGIVALFATANTALIALLAGSRLAFGMVREGDLPAFLGRVRAGASAPWTAALLLGAVAAALVPLGGVAAVASLASFAALVAFVIVNGSLVVLRYREPGRKRPFRVPLSVGRLPVFPVLGLASAGLLLFHFDAATYIGGAAALTAALLLFVARRFWRRA